MEGAVHGLDGDVTTGKPASGPLFMASSMPLPAAATYSFGTTPPTMALSYEKPTPRSTGDITMTMWAYWPRPPDWRTNLPSCLIALRIVSR